MSKHILPVYNNLEVVINPTPEEYQKLVDEGYHTVIAPPHIRGLWEVRCDKGAFESWMPLAKLGQLVGRTAKTPKFIMNSWGLVESFVVALLTGVLAQAHSDCTDTGEVVLDAFCSYLATREQRVAQDACTLVFDEYETLQQAAYVLFASNKRIHKVTGMGKDVLLWGYIATQLASLEETSPKELLGVSSAVS